MIQKSPVQNGHTGTGIWSKTCGQGSRNGGPRQISLTDPDSRLMLRSDAHGFRQAYNTPAVACAEGSQLIVTMGAVATSADAPSFADMVMSMEDTIGLLLELDTCSR